MLGNMKKIFYTIFLMLIFTDFSFAKDNESITYFAFGGTGYAGQISKGENKFSSILSLTDPLKDLLIGIKTAQFRKKHIAQAAEKRYR